MEYAFHNILSAEITRITGISMNPLLYKPELCGKYPGFSHGVGEKCDIQIAKRPL